MQLWAERNADQQPTSAAMSTVRLPLISLDDLLNVVRLSNLVSADAILDAIKLKNECKDMELSYRGFLSLYHFCVCRRNSVCLEEANTHESAVSNARMFSCAS